MVLRIVAVGRVRDAAIRTVCEEYAKRFSRYLPVEIREVPEARGQQASQVLRREGERIIGAIPRGSRMVALTRAGKTLSSREFARRLADWRREARNTVLVIGGAWGLDRTVLEASELKLSLSAMTMPHELARAVLLEQLYRASTILRGQPYHKGN